MVLGSPLVAASITAFSNSRVSSLNAKLLSNSWSAVKTKFFVPWFAAKLETEEILRRMLRGVTVSI